MHHTVGVNRIVPRVATHHGINHTAHIALLLQNIVELQTESSGFVLKEALCNEEVAKKCDEAQSMEDVLATLQSYGIETTKEEIVDALADIGDELTDNELDNVAGGGIINTHPGPFPPINRLGVYAKWIQERELLAKLPRFMVPAVIRKKYNL